MSANHHSEEQLRHERLCAYLFDELDVRERAAVEAELARDADYRAERERLAATIALVRDAVPAGDTLSDATRGALSAAAAQRQAGAPLAPIHPWPVRLARSPLTAAAAVVLVLGGIAGLALHLEPPAVRTNARWVSDAVASADRDDAARAKQSPELIELALRDEAGEQREQPQGEATADARTYRGPGDSVPNGATPVAAEEPRPVAGTPDFDLSTFERGKQADAEGSITRLDTGVPSKSATRLKEQEARDWILGVKVEVGAEAPLAEGSLGVYRMETGVAEGERKLGKLGYVGRAGEDKLDAAGAHAPAAGGGGPAAPAAPELQRFFFSEGPAPGTAGQLAGQSPEALRAGLAAGSAPPPPGGPGSPGPAASDVKNGSDGWFLGQGQSQPGLADGALGEMLAFDGADSRFDRLRLIEELGDDDAAGPFGGIGERRAQRGIDRYRADDIVRFCRIRPHETPSAMFFRCWGDNPFELAALDRLSTFAADVDTASYALARNYLSRGIMPTKAQIRTEEFVNSFGSGVPAPAKDVFGIDLEMAPSLFGSSGEWMLRVVVRGKEVDKQERPHLALTFVVDTSGSMKQENRIELVKHALRLLVGELDQNDAIAIVAFSTEARLVLPMTSAGNKAVIESAIFGLNADGSTNAEAGLMMGYAQAAQGLTAGANNRVVMLSDGVANVGNVDVAKLLGNVVLQRAQGIYLNTIGVGMGNHNDELLEQLADKGDGICNYIDTQAEAVKVLVDGFTGQFVPIARDVKIQIDFDPAQVQAYRLLGYENRAIADADFRKDEVDAGEVGAGHQVTALYEVVRAPGSSNDGPLATARVRYKPPFAIDSAKTDTASRAAAEVALEIEKPIAFNQVSTSFQGATVGYQKAVLVAQLAEFLRRSVHARTDSFDQLVTESVRLEKGAEDPAFTAFTTLLAASRDLIVRNLPPNDAVAQAIDQMTRHNYLQGKIAQLQAENHLLTDEILQRLQSQNADLERQLLELLQQHLQQGR